MSIEKVRLRERLQEELDGFVVEAAVFTSFTFAPDFFEQNVLPLLFGIEGQGRTRRRVQVNSRLASAPVSVFYDMTTQPRGGGEFRYQWVPVRLDKGGVFHPKLAIVAGHTKNDSQTPWVLACVTSANLTLSAWARNEEVAGTFWVQTEAQRDELLAMLSFLDDRAKIAALAASDETAPGSVEALPRLRAALTSLDVGSGSPAGYPEFRCFGLRRPDEATPSTTITPGRLWWQALTVFSPYWSNREDTLGLAKTFRARKCSLVPAARATGQRVRLGLDGDAGVSEWRVAEESIRSFRHAKLYLAEGTFRRKRRARVTLGSANFTTAALGRGKGAPLNVEALVAYDLTGRQAAQVVPQLTEMSDDAMEHADGISEEGERPLPFTIFVVFDWSRREYRIRLSDEGAACDFHIVLPGFGEQDLVPGDHTYRSDTGPADKRSYEIHYDYVRADGGREHEIGHGLITEIGLEESDHRYTPALSLNDFFASWFRADDDSVYDQVAARLGEDDDAESSSALEGVVDAPVDQLDATNLFEIYKALRELEKRRLEPAHQAGSPGEIWEYLVARPDSVDQLVRLLERQRTSAGVRFALLLECGRLLDRYGDALADAGCRAARKRARTALEEARSVVHEELRANPRVGRSAEPTLDWFERQLAEAWS